MDLEKKNFYERLGVAHDATDEQIKEAYRDIARIYHPDSNYFGDLLDGLPEKALSPRDHAVFQLVTEAYNTLVSPERRERYNVELRKAASWEKPSKEAGSVQHVQKPKQPRNAEKKIQVQVRERVEEPPPEPPPTVRSVADMIREERERAAKEEKLRKNAPPQAKLVVIIGAVIMLGLVLTAYLVL